MSDVETRKGLRALCHEHHVEMRFSQILLKTDGETTPLIAYSCSAPDCRVHYDVSHGYFLTTQDGSRIERDMTPQVSCPHERTPMYLAEVLAVHTSYRLWRCPQCNMARSNL
jgi:hypothetical protein